MAPIHRPADYPQMTLIKWQENYRTGIQGVDHEHRLLIEEVNRVYDMIDEGADKSQVIDSLGDIYGSIAAHFALEEQMMKTHRYDQYREHKNDHDRLLDEIRELTEDFEASETLDDAAFKKRLNDWFSLHFSTFDSRLHRMTQSSHKQVEDSIMQSLVRSAKASLFRRAG